MTHAARLLAATRLHWRSLLAALAAAVLAPLLLGGTVLALIISVAALGLAGWRWLGTVVGRVDGWFQRVRPAPTLLALDPALKAAWGDKPGLPNAGYDAIVGYLAAGIRAYRSPLSALVLYPGVPGTRGLRVEGLEGFARAAPLLAAWVRHRGDEIPLPDGESFDAFAHLAAGLTAGTDPSGPEYWGDIGDLDQRIIEAVDIALVAWMLQDRLQASLPPEAQAALLAWLGGIAGRRIYGGNWHLCPMMVGLVLESWGRPPNPLTRQHQAEFFRYAIGDGWFSDGLHGAVDHYNAWQMHYLLAFAAEIDPVSDQGRAAAALAEFAPGYSHFFAPHGFPIFGRSACYRMSVAAPLVLAAALPEPAIPPGLARRALDATWSHFIGRGALAAGTVTQGYESPDPDLLENYSGRGSSLWALRSLVAAYWQRPDAPIWTAAALPLPVERGDYDLTLAAPGFRVLGDAATGRVEVRLLRNAGAGAPPLQPLGGWRRLGQILLHRPLRRANYAAKYRREAYNSDRPFCEPDGARPG